MLADAVPPSPPRRRVAPAGGVSRSTTSSWSAGARPGRPRPPTSPGPATRCCCSTSPGGSSPAAARSRPALIRDFAIPDSLLVAKIRSARMVAPSGKAVDMPVGEGFVGMVDREQFDPWLRARARGGRRRPARGRLREDHPAGRRAGAGPLRHGGEGEARPATPSGRASSSAPTGRARRSGGPRCRATPRCGRSSPITRSSGCRRPARPGRRRSMRPAATSTTRAGTRRTSTAWIFPHGETREHRHRQRQEGLLAALLDPDPARVDRPRSAPRRCAARARRCP